MRVLSAGPRAGGAYAPAEIFDAQDFLAALEPHIRVELCSQPIPMTMG